MMLDVGEARCFGYDGAKGGHTKSLSFLNKNIDYGKGIDYGLRF